MARDHARIRLDIWADDDFRELPALPQWLYLHLLTSETLNFCGVADWRPARIAAVAADLTASDVEYAAAFLEQGHYLVIDRDTEEALIRSFVKHDGLIRSPNVTKAMVKAHGAVASKVLRAVIVGQLIRLKENQPEQAGWKVTGTLLRKRSMAVEEAFAELPPNPSVKGSGNPSEIRPELHTPYSLLPSPSSPSSSDSVSTVTSARRKAANG